VALSRIWPAEGFAALYGRATPRSILRVCPSAITLAAIVGTATNTVLVLGLGVARHYLPSRVAWAVGLTHGIPEIIVAVIISLAVLLSWKRVQKREARARV